MESLSPHSQGEDMEKRLQDAKCLQKDVSQSKQSRQKLVAVARLSRVNIEASFEATFKHCSRKGKL